MSNDRPNVPIVLTILTAVVLWSQLWLLTGQVQHVIPTGDWETVIPLWLGVALMGAGPITCTSAGRVAGIIGSAIVFSLIIFYVVGDKPFSIEMPIEVVLEERRSTHKLFIGIFLYGGLIMPVTTVTYLLTSRKYKRYIATAASKIR